jgi:hypothetical protein
LQFLINQDDTSDNQRKKTRLIIAYALIAQPEDNLEWWFFLILAITSGYMVNSFLCFAATNEFEIYFLGVGPTEIRVCFILLTSFIIIFDPGREYFSYGVPIYAGILALGLIFLARQSHAKLWVLDMKREKAKRTTQRNEGGG